MKKYRKFITSSVGFTFLVVGITGITFKFFFKNHLLEDIHGWLGIAMVAAACLHIFQNWQSIKSYLRDPRVWSLLLPVFAVILYFGLVQKEEAPGPNAKEIVKKLLPASAADISKVFGKDVGIVIATMRHSGLVVESPAQPIEAIAITNKQRPESILLFFIK